MYSLFFIGSKQDQHLLRLVLGVEESEWSGPNIVDLGMCMKGELTIQREGKQNS